MLNISLALSARTAPEYLVSPAADLELVAQGVTQPDSQPLRLALIPGAV